MSTRHYTINDTQATRLSHSLVPKDTWRQQSHTILLLARVTAIKLGMRFFLLCISHIEKIDTGASYIGYCVTLPASVSTRYQSVLDIIAKL